jgi:diaphanous 1
VTHIAYSLHTSSLKLRSLVAEVLAAICVLSLVEGHRLVLAAMSDYRVAHDEAFRFEQLVASLRLPDHEIEGVEEEEGVWEARTAALALVNAITNCPEAVEERVMLREEFGRRGLNEVIVVRISVYEPLLSRFIPPR